MDRKGQLHIKKERQDTPRASRSPYHPPTHPPTISTRTWGWSIRKEESDSSATSFSLSSSLFIIFTALHDNQPALFFFFPIFAIQPPSLFSSSFSWEHQVKREQWSVSNNRKRVDRFIFLFLFLLLTCMVYFFLFTIGSRDNGQFERRRYRRLAKPGLAESRGFETCPGRGPRKAEAA